MVSWLTMPAAPRNPALLQAQAAAFSRQVPLMYAIVILNTLGVAWSHLGAAPWTLTLLVPSILCASSILRLVAWWRRRNIYIDPERARAMLKSTLVFAAVLGVGFTAWALSLFPYGDGYQNAHVAFFMAFTTVGCMLCLMHLREASLMLACIVVIPMVAYLVGTGIPVFLAIAVNMAVVTVALAIIMLSYHRAFRDLVESRLSLEARQIETQRLSDENLRLANLDGLTGLPNRRQFFARLHEATARAAERNSRVAVGVIDLDGFKPVNDAFGHAIGDRVLIETGRRLTGVDEQVFVARLGGDEYGIIIEEALGDAALAALGARLCQVLRTPHTMPAVTAQVSGSLGLAIFPDAALDAEALYECADYALYFAKANTRGAPVVYSKSHETSIRQVSCIEQALRHADMERELALAFQPIVDFDTGRTLAFEALARWTSPTLGFVSPGDFIPVAERSGMITRMTPLLLRRALAAARSWPDGIRLSFNLSAQDLASPEQIAILVDVIENSGLPPSRLDLEITETAVMRDFDQAKRSLTVLNAMGAGLALDDFGTGQSSLSYVHRLPLQKLKIDRSFVIGLEEDGSSRDVVKTILGLCRNLSLDCIVEGVETTGQLLVLRSLGCRVGQGYYFSRPIPEEALDSYLSAGVDLTLAVPLQTTG
ncbi:MAG TPA: EAL domain-containing protein [Aurantimonas sp.]|nr:EAL domain-containing protein [Aurantimonas sp.]